MNEASLRALRVAVVVMGVLIVLGVIGLVGGVVYRSRSAIVAPAPLAVAAPDAVLDEPAGTRIAGVALGEGRVLVTLQGAGPDRVTVLDARSGRVLQRIRLSHGP